ncbi:uncharacterized protein [Dermacentor albipictus]|uniref:uncharacterized protein n=1 Tax=Dermacentor albipictus TaxID=60249 RepID=UPI0031FCFFBD
MCVGAVFLFGVAAPWCCTGRRKSELRAEQHKPSERARARVESCDRAAICQRAHSSTAVDVSHCFEPSRLHDYWIRRHLSLGGRSRTVVAAVSLPAVRMKQLHNRRSVASHQFPFSAIEVLDAFLPVLHPVTDHSNDLGRIVTQEEVRLAPSLV